MCTNLSSAFCLNKIPTQTKGHARMIKSPTHADLPRFSSEKNHMGDVKLVCTWDLMSCESQSLWGHLRINKHCCKSIHIQNFSCSTNYTRVRFTSSDSTQIQGKSNNNPETLHSYSIKRKTDNTIALSN